MRRILASLALFCVLATTSPAAWAQDSLTVSSDAASGGWRWVVEPYFMFPTMTGESGVRGLVADVDASTGDILEKLDFGAMAYVELQNPTWAFSLDLMFMDLGADGSTRLGDVRVDLSQLGCQGAAYRRMTPWAEATLALQYNSIKSSLDGSGPLNVAASDERTWVDPYVGIRLTSQGRDPWRLGVTASVGGFGLGSDFAWQAFPQAGYRFNDTFELSGGYRLIFMDYADGAGSDEFLYKMTTHGPQLGARFHF